LNLERPNISIRTTFHFQKWQSMSRSQVFKDHPSSRMVHSSHLCTNNHILLWFWVVMSQIHSYKPCPVHHRPGPSLDRRLSPGPGTEPHQWLLTPCQWCPCQSWWYFAAVDGVSHKHSDKHDSVCLWDAISPNTTILPEASGNDVPSLIMIANPQQM
jgi:hypothetical protein